MVQITNIVLLGTGGQGALTMMEMLAIAAEQADEEVRVLSHVGLGRLGGSVLCHIRLGPSASAAIPISQADFLVALEMNEVLHALPLARRGATALINTYRRLPLAAGLAGRPYPTRTEIEEALQANEVQAVFVPPLLSHEESQLEETPINMIMLGVLCSIMQRLPRSIVEAAIVQRLPTYVDQNLRTFAAGWQFGDKLKRG